MLEVTPEISSAGIKNGAGETPVAGVAPGSVISIFGASLATNAEIGPVNPLTQSLDGVTVQVAGRILPLFFVSPEQINAQLPTDLPLGTHTVVVKNRNMQDVSATFEVVRNAPGLFTSRQDGRAVATITRVGGPAVTADNPVKGGELINIYGTGFGPHRNPPPEGFGVEEADGYRLTDSVEIVAAGNHVIIPEYAGTAAGLPGTVLVRFRVPDDISEGSLTNLTVRVNGVPSNTAALPTAASVSNNADQGLQ